MQTVSVTLNDASVSYITVARDDSTGISTATINHDDATLIDI